MTGASDATWASQSGKSIATCAFFYNHACLYAGIKCIPSVQLNSNQAEKWSEASAQATGIWLANMLVEMGEPRIMPVRMRCDNSIAVAQSQGVVMSKDSKHYLRRIAFTEDNEAAGLFQTEHVSTDQMIADFIGKWVPIKKYITSRAHMLNLVALVPHVA